jgi:hypothetical protein
VPSFIGRSKLKAFARFWKISQDRENTKRVRWPAVGRAVASRQRKSVVRRMRPGGLPSNSDI